MAWRISQNEFILHGHDMGSSGFVSFCPLVVIPDIRTVGAGFGLLDLGNPLGRISLGICMDLNPFPPAIWNSEEGPYELASFVIDNDTRLVVILCAWLDSKAHPEEPWDRQTLNYWIARLFPLWRHVDDRQTERETIVAICNRAGADGGSYYTIRTS
jgi:protein N-terminal amidase